VHSPGLVAAWLAARALAPVEHPLPAAGTLSASADAWAYARAGAIRGITLGPIESLRHPGKGYGTAASARAMDEAVALGATWVSLTPFGRVHDLDPEGIDLAFEAPAEDNRRAVLEAIHQAHARGLKVLIVPHLWVESGEWRALIDPKTDEGWDRWRSNYMRFVLHWAEVAREGRAEMLSVGVELRTFTTTRRAAAFRSIVREVRAVYPGLLTYSANWDDAEQVLVWDELDLVGINAFYPLAQRAGADRAELAEGGERVAESLGALARDLAKPVLLTEIGYTTRTDPALRPWEWPDSMTNVVIDEQAQADAYAGLLGPLPTADWCAGFFVWRYYADPDDVSQEAEWGFSPRGKLAELVVRDAFTAHHLADGPWLPGGFAGRHRARTPGWIGWEPSPGLFD
jgi:hypothetical protein